MSTPHYQKNSLFRFSFLQKNASATITLLFQTKLAFADIDHSEVDDICDITRLGPTKGVDALSRILSKNLKYSSNKRIQNRSELRKVSRDLSNLFQSSSADQKHIGTREKSPLLKKPSKTHFR